MKLNPLLNDYYEWLETAWSNFERACRGFRSQDCAQCVFYAHETIEAAFKAFLLKKGIKPLRTHDIAYLYEHVINLGLELTISKDIFRELTKHYYATGYPDARRRLGISPEYYDRDIAMRFLELAFKVLQKVEGY